METDGELMRRVAHGDDGAFAALVDRHRCGAERYAMTLLDDEAAAQDAVEDSFIKVYLLREQYSDRFTFQTYLFTLVRNRAVDELRKRARQQAALPLLKAAHERSAATPEEAYIKGERQLRLIDTLDKLEPLEKRLLLGFALEGMSYQQLASENRIGMAQVKIKLHRLRRRIKRIYEED